jgi:hypothetical protein
MMESYKSMYAAFSMEEATCDIEDLGRCECPIGSLLFIHMGGGGRRRSLQCHTVSSCST